MTRNTLARYLRRLLIASALSPLAGCGSPTTCDPTEFTTFNALGSFQISDGGVGDGGMLSESDCNTLCSLAVNGPGQNAPYGRVVKSCTLATKDGVAGVDCVGVCGLFTGRRPAGLCEVAPLDGADPIGAWLARAAHLEAASVHAFVRLRRELTSFGAPPALTRAAIAAARDEARHAGATATLARRYGARPAAVAIAPVADRSLEAIAIENAVEGCVGETWGALIALAQSERAADPAIRAAMGPIADDEIRHAELAWAVDAWARTRLDSAVSARVDAARREAARTIAAAAPTPLDDRLAAVAGVPTSREAAQLAAQLCDGIWA